MNIIAKLQSSNYVATDRQIEELARTAADGSRAGGTYLRVLVAAVQADMGVASNTGKRPRGRPRHQASGTEASVEACERTHTRLYELVKRGIGATGSELNRRATFARTAASTLRSWLAAGGRIAALDVAKVTKRQLAPARDPAAAWSGRVELFVVAAQRMGPDAVRAAIEALQSLDTPRVVSTQGLRRVASQATTTASH